MAMPVAAEPSNLAFEEPSAVLPSDSRRRKPRRRRSGLVMILVTVLIVGSLTGAAIWGILWGVRTYGDGDSDAVVQDTEPGNFRFTRPAGAWTEDKQVKTDMIVNFALARRSPANNLAVFFKDYSTRLPTEAEMQDVALTKLRSYFKPMEWERKPKSDVKLGGQPVSLHLEFEGTAKNGVPVNGECLVMAHKGVGYWVYTWCPSEIKETVSPEWERLRSGFVLLNNRENWKETPRKLEYVALDELPFEVGYYKEVWAQQKADKWDPNARLAFLGFDPSVEYKHANKAANFIVLVREKADSSKAAVDAAKKYFEDQQKEDYPDTLIKAVKDKHGKDEDRATGIGTERGHLVKLYVQNSETRERYVVMGIVQTAENVLIFKGDCEFSRKDYWDVEFMAMINSLRRTRK